MRLLSLIVLLLAVVGCDSVEGGGEVDLGSSVEVRSEQDLEAAYAEWLATGPEDLVMDFFAGSGTTGHAVLAENLQAGTLYLLDREISSTATPGDGGYRLHAWRLVAGGLALQSSLPSDWGIL